MRRALGSKTFLILALAGVIAVAAIAPRISSGGGIDKLLNGCGGTNPNGTPNCGIGGGCFPWETCTLVPGGGFFKKNPPYCACRVVRVIPMFPIASA